MRYVQVYRAHGALEAEIIRNFLEAAGIPARVFQESAGLTLGLTVGSLGEAMISVPESYENEAIQQLDAMESGELLSDVEFPDDAGDFEDYLEDDSDLD
jgi:hypothetical protein